MPTPRGHRPPPTQYSLHHQNICKLFLNLMCWDLTSSLTYSSSLPEYNHTWPEVITMRPVASSRLSATMAPLQKQRSSLCKMSWRNNWNYCSGSILYHYSQRPFATDIKFLKTNWKCQGEDKIDMIKNKLDSQLEGLKKSRKICLKYERQYHILSTKCNRKATVH